MRRNLLLIWLTRQTMEQLENEQAGCSLHIARIGISSGLVKALELIDDILAK